jgi:hypothetical protein
MLENVEGLHVLNVVQGGLHVLLQHLVAILFRSEFIWKRKPLRSVVLKQFEKETRVYIGSYLEQDKEIQYIK